MKQFFPSYFLMLFDIELDNVIWFGKDGTSGVGGVDVVEAGITLLLLGVIALQQFKTQETCKKSELW